MDFNQIKEYLDMIQDIEELKKEPDISALIKRYGLEVVEAKFDEINNLFTDGSESINAELAYNVFKPLNDKVVSKAIVAQKLAIEIGKLASEDKEQLKTKVLSNDYTQYLVNAIKHAAQINEEEGGTDE
jgi:putative ATP-dependent endonuclease of OLD family